MWLDMPGHREANDHITDDRVNKPHANGIHAECERPNKDHAEADHATHERRRSPRFSCGGSAEIICLPSTGIIVPGSIRDLSLHGCWVETSVPIDHGARAEVVLRVNSASFRALGEVKAIRGQSGSGVEFVRLSANGKDMLADLVMDRRAELIGRELEDGNLRAGTLRDRFLFLRTILSAENVEAEMEQTESTGADAIQEDRLVVPVDLFG
jgi:hypothetical protein